MKICLIVGSMGAGGSERVAATLSNAWAAEGREVTLIVTYSGHGECFYRLSDNVRLVYLADLVKSTRKTAFTYLRRIISLRRLVNVESPDVVVSFLANVNIAAILATSGLGIPVIACERSNPVADYTKGPVCRCLRRLTYPFADMVTVQAESAAADFRKAMPRIKSLGVIANPLAPELEKLPIPDTLPEGRFRLAAMGRLSDEKQFSGLIDIFHTLSVNYPDWDLWIWGEGPERVPLEKKIAELGLTERVRLPGRTGEPWLELAKAHVFVFNSAFEGFPNALLEAMALGLPCVAFDCPSGPREMSRNGQDALLVPHNDWGKLSDALARVMSDEELRRELGRRAAGSVRDRYSLAGVLSQWNRLFSEIGALRP